MRITIESVDAAAIEPLGCAQYPSFPIRFRSENVCGAARFVPATGTPEGVVGETYEVELNQETVSAFELVKSSDRLESMVALAEPRSFRVQGVIAGVHPMAEPPGEKTIYVTVHDGWFMLTSGDISHREVVVGDAVAFTVHELSLWDEAI